MGFTFNSVEEAVEEIKNGRMIIVVDDEDRENEGDIICSAELCTPEMVNFMATHARGLVCVSVSRSRAIELELQNMVKSNTALHGTKFTESVDYIHDTTTGISASDRAKTIRALADPSVQPSDLARPGHIFPLVAAEEGVLRRAGHTEATVDLMRLAGLHPAGVLCEIMKGDGEMARVPELMEFAKEHDMKIITVQELIAYRLASEKLVRRAAEAQLPTEWGTFNIIAYQNNLDGKEHIALTMGDISDGEPVLLRVHSECLTGDIFHSMRCDCGDQLDAALKMIAEEKRGVLLYMRQEGRGIGLVNKLRAYQLQDKGLDTVEANEKLGFKPDERDYGIGAQILVDLGISKMKLMTNNIRKRVGLSSFGLEVVERVPIETTPNSHNEKYLETKRSKMGHLLNL